MNGAAEIVRLVLTGDWRCPPNETPMHRAVTSNPATAESAARDVVEALRCAGLLKQEWYRGTTSDGEHLVCSVDPYACYAESTVSLDGRVLVLAAVRRLRDGGTTIMETDVGTITIPSPLRGNLEPTVTNRV